MQQNTDIFALILAGGVGQRMGNMEKPKQYIELNGKPIIIHTVEKFYLHTKFQKIIVLCPEQWVEHTKNLVDKHLPAADERVIVLAGGDSRNDTLMKGIDYIEKHYTLSEQTVVVTHDAVRPFVTMRIIEENIEAALEYGACDTVMPATDTIVVSTDGGMISEIPERNRMYQGQTPQSFKAKQLRELYQELSEEEKRILTDAAKICVMKGQPVKLVRGEVFNMKITYPFDLDVAKTLVEE